MSSFALRSMRVCTASGLRPATVVVEGQQISTVASHDTELEGVVVYELGELVVSPGMIDTHVHVNEPGTDWEGFESATKAAVAGGITTIVDMPLNSMPVTTSVAALAEKRAAAAESICRVDVGFYGGLVPGNIDQIRGLIDAGVFGVKAFLCHSGLDEFPSVIETDLRSVLPILKEANIPLLVHAELVDPQIEISNAGAGSYPAYLDSRPDRFELDAIDLLIRLCREFETRIHVVHLATAKAIERIAIAKEEGLLLTVETCPHYLYFAAEQIPDGATQFKCAPPIRNEQNREMLCAALEDGIIDSIGSDHSPCPVSLKCLRSGSFKDAWGGIAGLQLTLSAIWTVGRKFGWRPEQLCTWLSGNPAKLVGLENRKGQLAAGLEADIVVWDPDEEFEVDQNSLFHRHPCSPYHGRRLKGVVKLTYVRGHLVFDAGKFPTNSSGKLVVR